MNGTRRQGLGIFLVGAGLAVAIGAFASKMVAAGYSIFGWGWALPGAVALAGLVQLVSGVPFSELSRRWDELAGWQRGVLGTLIFILASALILGIFLVCLRLAYG